jgi:hypothetical protein|tara:strand:- start:344 stop:481 length:138 start_codon:yes stop_codon:yes gene_type:complete
MNTDASPLHINTIPGSAELPTTIHPYITGESCSPDSFALQPEFIV